MRKIYRFLALLTGIIFSVAFLQAQEIMVKGEVQDNEGETLPGVSVVVKGTTHGTVTDIDGNFAINVPRSSTLEFSYIGFQSQEIIVTNQEYIKVTLNPSTIGLDEVMVVAYGTQSRRTLTSSVSKVNTEEIENMSVNNIMDALKGKVAGARIYGSSGQPGESPSIIIRGGSSINKSNSPLILIDGFERSYNEVNPNDIESIQILKDAESTALYGSRASNGIVLITTKSGSSTTPRITFQSDFSLQQIERYYNLTSVEEYLSILRPSVARGPNPKWNDQNNYAYSGGNLPTSSFSTHYLKEGEMVPEGWKTMPDPLDTSKTLVFQDNDMLDIAFNNALRQNYYVGVEGGEDNFKFSASVGYTDDEGVAMGTDWERFSARAAGDYRIKNNLNVFTNISYQKSILHDYSNQNQAVTRSLYLPPTQKIYNEDGTFAKGYNATAAPLPWWTNIHQRETLLRQTSASGGINWGITDNIIATGTASTYFSTREFDGFQRANEFNSLRRATSTLNNTERNQFEGLLKYNNSFGKHVITGLLGASYMNTKVKALETVAQGASSDKIETLNAAPDKIDATTTKTEEVLASVFARATYNYDNKYLMSASIRRDGSSRFGANHKWAYFPGVSVGWVVSEEDFLRNNSTLSFFKLRSSLGMTGNNAVGIYTAQGNYNATYRYNNMAGIVNTSMPNPNLTWETTTQIDLGLDAGFINDKLLLTFDVFNKRTDDLIFSKPLPNTSGFNSIETNIGSVRFYGFDIEITSTNIQTSNFSWETSFAWGYVKNKVVSLPDNGQYKNRIGGIYLPDNQSFGGIAEGESLYRIYGYKVDYILDTDEQASNARYDQLARGFDYRTGKYTQGQKFAGDFEWKDRDGDGRITEVDQFELGVTVPHSTGGITNTVNYKNFSLRIYLDWALGHTIPDTDFKFHMMSTFNGNTNLVREALSAWKQPGDAKNTKWARIAAHDSNENWNYRRDSDIVTFKGDYLSIRDISLGYSIPKTLIQRIGMNSATVFISGNNLHYFTAVQATPPEVGEISNSNTGYPPIRKFTIGFKIDF